MAGSASPPGEGHIPGCAIAGIGVLAWLAAMLALVLAGGASSTGPAATPTPSSAAFLYSTTRVAPPIDLIDPQGQPFSLAGLRGEDVFVFFGYTHCPDVCPATVGILGQVLATAGHGARALFVTIDPARDTPAWLAEYLRFAPHGLLAVTGSSGAISATAAAWGVRYARIDTGSAAGYAMAHTADVFLVGADGFLRARFPFGTDAPAMLATLRLVDASTPVHGAGTSALAPVPETSVPSSTPLPSAGAASLSPQVVSTSVWSGPADLVILTLDDAQGPIDDPHMPVSVQVEQPDGAAVGSPVAATPVQPPGVARVSFVAPLVFPGPGPYQLRVTAASGASLRWGSVSVTALDPGGTAPLGAPAPPVHTPTLADVGGNPRAVTTDPAPDLRLSQQSTTDALAAHQPFVLVIDSPKFRVSPFCGKAVVLARYLADRWPAVAFIHLEPYAYTLVADTPVLSSDIANPQLTPVAASWGVGSAPWGARSMPWVFVVDGRGVVRARYQGLVGTDEVDVLLASIAQGN